MIHLRPATLTDVDGIASVANDVWSQDVLPDACRAHIEDSTRALWVAAEDGAIAGFASAFLTVVADIRRWEIDLLAVKRANQGRGLGTRLIAHTSRTGRSHAVSLTRALVRADNVAGQRAFQTTGFARDPRLHALLLWPPAIEPAPRPYAGPVTLLPVDTLTYRGLWIEHLTSVPPDEQHRALAAARAIAARDHRLNAGAVIPVHHEHLLSPELRIQARTHGHYHWYVSPSQSDPRHPNAA